MRVFYMDVALANLEPSAPHVPVAMGGGGAQTGLHTYSDGTILTKGDTSSAWSYSPTLPCTQGGKTYPAPCWNQDLTAKTLPSSLVSLKAFFALYGGAAEYVAAPSNTSVRYMVWAFGQNFGFDQQRAHLGLCQLHDFRTLVF